MPQIQFLKESHWQNLHHLTKILNAIRSANKEDHIEINTNSFATPFHIVPVACVINNKNLSFSLTKKYSDLGQYLETVRFPNGVTAMEANLGASGNYLPIARISGDESTRGKRESSYKHVEDQYRELLFNCFKSIKEKLSNAIAFFLSELIENAKDHSEADNFYIFA